MNKVLKSFGVKNGTLTELGESTRRYAREVFYRNRANTQEHFANVQATSRDDQPLWLPPPIAKRVLLNLQQLPRYTANPLTNAEMPQLPNIDPQGLV
mgnify:FL=1